MDLDLKGKICLVTGSSRGLGYAAALQLARESANVAINGRDIEKVNQAASQLAAETGAQVIALPADLSDPAVPAQLVQAVVDRWGGLDILVTNAGGPPPGLFDRFADEDWEAAVNLSFLSHVRLIRAALPYLKQSKAASVLTVTSSAVKQPISNLVLSNSTRLATIGLTKSLAQELGGYGIRFNSILPGWTETQRVEQLMMQRSEANHTTPEEEKSKLGSNSPLGRIGQPEEFGKAAAFLVSPAASYITGVMLLVDGGAYKGTF